MPHPVLFIVPSSITENVYPGHHNQAVRNALAEAKVLMVENLKPARRFVKALLPDAVVDGYQWIDFDKHTGLYPAAEVQAAFASGNAIALLSDAGYPSIGDPGFALVHMAHQAGVEVRPLPGACSFLMALAASGLNGQQFAFHGYLPFGKVERQTFLRDAEAISKRTGATQICMDTPYRNQATLVDLLTALAPQTRLCVALGVLEPGQYIATRQVATWRKAVPDLVKLPAVFLFQA